MEHYEKSLHIREKVIINGGSDQFKDWAIVIRGIISVKDSTKLIEDHKNTLYASRLLAESCDKLAGVNDKIKPLAVSEYGNLSWWALLNKDYILSEKAALRSLELDKTQEWVLTNLAHSQLLRGQYAAAKATYEKLKGKKNGEGKDYKVVIIQDFIDLEAGGITHKKIAKIKVEIEKW